MSDTPRTQYWTIDGMSNKQSRSLDPGWVTRAEYDARCAYAEELKALLSRFHEFERDSSGYCEWCGAGRGTEHFSDCIYPEVRAVLAKNSVRESGGSTPPRSQRSGETGAGFESPEVAQGAKGAAGTADKAAAESVAGATFCYGVIRGGNVIVAFGTRESAQTYAGNNGGRVALLREDLTVSSKGSEQ